MNPGDIFYGILALVVIGSAVGMLLSRNAVYSALFLVLNFGTVGFLYVILGAPFIAMTQIAVYAGAIMVLFLFVIMLLGAESLPPTEPIRGQIGITIVFCVIFVTEAALVILWKGGSPALLPMPESTFASPSEIGMALFSKYLLPFEITSVILLAALIGAIVLTKQDKILTKDHATQNPRRTE
jgi:NADH-quinone oxidoreductase subunit J